MKFKAALFFGFWFGMAGLIAQPEMLLNQVRDAYSKKDYEQVINLSERLLGEGYFSAALHFNLGNAYYRSSRLGKAILHYEKALKYAPGDEDVHQNLLIARQRQVDQLDQLNDFFLIRWWRQAATLMNSSNWSIFGILLIWSGATGLSIWLLGGTRRKRQWGFFAGLFLALLSLLPFALAFSRYAYEHHSGQAILINPTVSLHSAPDAESQLILELHEGLKVSLEDAIGDWWKVRLSDGSKGWLPMAAVEEI